MRLPTVEKGRGFKSKVVFTLFRWMTGHTIPDVMRVMLYRQSFFGKPFSAASQLAMRGPSEWTAGERELMAAYTSKCNACIF
jgi:hypothetical protein